MGVYLFWHIAKKIFGLCKETHPCGSSARLFHRALFPLSLKPNIRRRTHITITCHPSTLFREI